MTTQTAGDVGGLADRVRPGFYDHAADFATMTNAELCERLRGNYPSGARYKPEPLAVEAARRIETLEADLCLQIGRP